MFRILFDCWTIDSKEIGFTIMVNAVMIAGGGRTLSSTFLMEDRLVTNRTVSKLFEINGERSIRILRSIRIFACDYKR